MSTVSEINTFQTQESFVDEALYHRMSQYVHNALGGKGSLEGFFRYVEAETFKQFGTPGGYSNADLERDHSPAFITLRKFSSDQLVNDLDCCRDVFEQVTREVGWYGDNPAAVHTMALFYIRLCHRTLLQAPLGWTGTVYPNRFTADLYYHARRLVQARDHKSLNITHEFLYCVGTTGLKASARHNHEPFYRRSAPLAKPRFNALPVWQGDHLDFLLRSSQPCPIALSLAEQHHRFFVNLLGNDFFQRTLYVLDDVFRDKDNWIDIEPEARFLEHGPAIFDLEGASWDKEEMRSVRNYFDWFREYYDCYKSGEATSEELLSIAYDVHSWSDEEEEDEHSATYIPVPRHTVLRQAQRLGLLKLDQEGLDEVKRVIEEHFLSYYQLPELLLETEYLYAIMKNRYHNKIVDRAAAMTYRSAADFHIFELFKRYAASVLPEAGPLRVATPVLATLAQPWVFETRNLLEAYSGLKVTQTATGGWRLGDDEVPELELTITEAYGVAECLKQIAPFYKGESEDVIGTVSEFETWSRVTLPTGLPLIARVLERVRACPAADRHRFTLAGIGIDICTDLIDEVLGAQGQIKRRLYTQYTERYRRFS